MPKQRITVTLDRSLIDAAKAAVLDGRSESVSALVADALRARLEDDARLRDLREAVEAYESAHGAFTDEELATLEREDRLAAANGAKARARRAG